jgi:hypothetical protein
MATYGTVVLGSNTFTLYGFPGSTVLDELNRLANGGTYPNYQNYLDLQGAANKWTGAPAGTALNASFNYKIDPNRQPANFQESIDAINTIAATSTKRSENVEAVTALRTISH